MFDGQQGNEVLPTVAINGAVGTRLFAITLEELKSGTGFDGRRNYV